MVDTVKKTINGTEYEVLNFTALQNYSYALKLLAILGASFEDLAGMFEGAKSLNDVMDMPLNPRAIGASLNEVLKSIHANDPKGDFIVEILSQTKRDGDILNKTRIDTAFMGKMDEFKEVVIFSLMTHFTWVFPKSLTGILTQSE